MKVEFLKKFSKDLDNLKLRSVKQTLLHHIEFLDNAETLDKIPNTKKLQGHKTACRTRIGCAANRLQIYAQLFGFASFFANIFFQKENVGKFEVAGCRCSITANGSL